MLHNTRGIVLRSVKYGETSLITTIFTEKHGVESYMVQGARSSSAKNNRSAALQPGMLLNLISYHKPNTNLQRLREFQYAYLYTSLQEKITKNSIALFSIELLLRIMPEHAAMPEVFDFAFQYFQQLDQSSDHEVANFPLHFTIQCCKLLGYEIHGEYTANTPHLNIQEGAFTHHMPPIGPFANDEEAKALSLLLKVSTITELSAISLNAELRNRILDWLLEFLKQHTQHMGNLKSLEILRTILH
jgi:DNA repair protein RecO (recombination protein O)